ncbi:MAG: YjdF family protein [Candidatus Ventricola sp.]
MDESCAWLTVYFEDPFWVGVFERVEGGRLCACKVTFGAEPKDAEVWGFLLTHYDQLRFSPAVEAVRRQEPSNPKRMQREARRQSESTGIGTRSQQALKLQHEQSKALRQEASREQRDAERQRQFELKQQKRREKHRGR